MVQIAQSSSSYTPPSNPSGCARSGMTFVLHKLHFCVIQEHINVFSFLLGLAKIELMIAFGL